MNRAYSVLNVKAVDDDHRVITGIATTPTPDRMGDIVEPLGVKFSNPMPLLRYHDSRLPVGTVVFDKPTAEGITFRATLPKVAEPGELQNRVDTAWGEIKLGLIRGVSIGFRPIEYAYMDDGGVRFLSSEVIELSLVAVPANAEAGITTIKSIDAPYLAALGIQEKSSDRPKRPGVSGTKNGHAKGVVPVKSRSTTMNIEEQIKQFEAARKVKSDRMDELMTESAKKGETLGAEESDEYDGLEAEVKGIDDHIKRLRRLQEAQKHAARPVVGNDSETGSQSRDTVPAQVKVQPKLDKGIRFARVAKCIGLAHKTHRDPIVIAEDIYGKTDPIIVAVVKAAVSAGNTANSTWAGALVGDETSVFADFVEFLRPQTILGRFGQAGVPSLRRVPFRVPLIGQTTGGQGYWVGEGAPKPLTKFDFVRTTLEPLKVANIAVVTMEVLRDSSPSAEGLVRDQLAAALRERLDIDFIDPDKAAASGVSPASITNGVTPIPSSGTDADAVRSDVKAIFGEFIAANNAPTTGVWVMSATTALALSLMLNPLGQREFPGIGLNGGTFWEMPVIVSEYVPSDSSGSFVALVNASDIYLADDGDVNVDMSTEASLQMDNAPTNNSVTPTATQLVSLWQTNSVGFRAERTVNWAKRRASAVALLSGVNWGS